MGAKSSAQSTDASRSRWIWVALILVWLSGFLGYLQYASQHARPIDWSTAAYLAVRLFAFHMPLLEPPFPWTLDVARWVAPVVTGWAAIRAFQRAFHRERLLLQHRKIERHVVVCGLGELGWGLVESLRTGRKRVPVLAIERDRSNPFVNRCQHLGVPVITGDATDETTLGKARVREAARVLVSCGADATNINCSLAIQSLLGKTAVTTSPSCDIHVQDFKARVLLQRRTPANSGHVSFRYFDSLQHEASALFTRLPLDHGGIAPTACQTAHLIVVGFGRMGHLLALRAAQLGHFANGRKLRLSIIDRDAPLKKTWFDGLYPAFQEVCEPRWHALEIDGPEAAQLLNSSAAEPDAHVTILLTARDEWLNIRTALGLMDMLCASRAALGVRIQPGSRLPELLRREIENRAVASGKSGEAPAHSESDCGSRVAPFGLVSDVLAVVEKGTPQREALARVIHEEYRSKRSAKRPADDLAVRPWETLDDAYRESNRQQADHAAIKLRALGCEMPLQTDPRSEAILTPKEVEIAAEMEHTRWIAERKLAGWKFDPNAKDQVALTSPWLRPWNELPEQIKQCDRDTVNLIPVLARLIGRKVCRARGG